MTISAGVWITFVIPAMFTSAAADVMYLGPRGRQAMLMPSLLKFSLRSRTNESTQPCTGFRSARTVRDILVHRPEKSGLPSGIRGAGAAKSGLPSAVRGMPRVGSLNHCAESETVSANAMIVMATGFMFSPCG